MSVITVAYHSITPTWHNDLAVRPERFALQLQKLADRGYKGVTFRDAALGDQNRNVVAITFDDAFASVAEFAAPILRERGWPATVFPVTEAVTSGEPMSWLAADGNGAPSEELLPLNWAQLSELSKLGWEIGSHSRTHRLLSRLTATELHDEIGGSREDVTAHVGSCASFSYPWGVVSPRAIDKVAESGYEAASGLAGRFFRHNLFAVPRFAITAVDNDLRFRMKTSTTVHLVRTTPLWDMLLRVRHPEPAVYSR
jgi:peptidoglycan/xylan/chitin deacetylase (PgdA/CDA1 family)